VPIKQAARTDRVENNIKFWQANGRRQDHIGLAVVMFWGSGHCGGVKGAMGKRVEADNKLWLRMDGLGLIETWRQYCRQTDKSDVVCTPHSQNHISEDVEQ
jgi:hypothetical protein